MEVIPGAPGTVTTPPSRKGGDGIDLADRQRMARRSPARALLRTPAPLAALGTKQRPRAAREALEDCYPTKRRRVEKRKKIHI